MVWAVIAGGVVATLLIGVAVAEASRGRPLYGVAIALPAAGIVIAAVVWLDSMPGLAPWHVGSALHGAAGRGDLVAVSQLVSEGADVDAVGARGCTPLTLAIRGGHTDVVAFLVDNGADARAAVMEAVRAGQEGVLRTLLRRGGDVNRGNGQETPLIEAIRLGYANLAALLIQSGADVGQVGQEGQTALHLAALMGDEGTARLLIDYGADVEAKNSRGQSPLDLARAHGRRSIVEILDSRESNTTRGG